MLRNAKAWLFKKPVWLFPIITVWPLKVLLHSKYYFILAKKINCSGVTEITCLMQCSRLRGFSSRSFDSSQRVFSTSFEDFWQDVVSKKTNLYGMDFSENAHKQTTHIWKYRTYIANNGHLSTTTASVFFPADSPYIVSCLNLSTTATATEAHPQQPKITSRQRPKKVKNCYEIWSYGASIINRSNHTLIVFHLYCCSKHELSAIPMANVVNLSRFLSLIFWFQTLVRQVFCVFYFFMSNCD